MKHRNILSRARSTEFFPLLLGLILLISHPILELILPSTDFLFSGFFTLFIILSLSITLHHRKKLITGIFLVIIAMGAYWLSKLYPSSTIYPVVRLLGVFAFTMFIVIELFRQIMLHETVAFETLIGIVAGYMLLGVIGGELSLNLITIVPTSYNVAEGSDAYTMLYYSFMTLLTVGYGDVLPQTGSARVLAIFLGIAGQVYLTIIVAIFIGKFLSARNDD